MVVWIIIPSVLHTTPEKWAWGGTSPPFQLVPMKWTFRQKFSNLPKTLKEPLNSPEWIWKAQPWLGTRLWHVGSSPWCSGRRICSCSAAGSGCSSSSMTAAGSELHRLVTPKCILRPGPVFKCHGSSLSSESD